MEKRLILVLILAFGMSTLAISGAEQEKPKIKKEQCLGCHGSYDKLAEKTSDWKAPSGETTTPHRYVPHEEKTDIPECTECHTPHIIPLQDKSAVVKPKDIGFCFNPSCHHMQNLKPCKECHDH
jgi:hypothetical protein